MRFLSRFTMLLGLASLSFAGTLGVGDFTFNQIGTSNVGNFAVDNSVGSGFVNVVDKTTNTWIVQNMWVGLEQQQGLASGLQFTNSYFNLPAGFGGDNIEVDFSSANNGPLATITAVEGDGGTVGTFADPSNMEDAACLANSGAPNGVAGCNPAAAANGLINFNTLLGTSASYQQDHPNVLAGYNQCAPAAVANSLTWLGVSPPENNIPGTFGNPANSLVAQLDLDMGRANTGCGPNGNQPCGVWPLNGKLQWLGDNNHAGLSVNVWDSSGGVSGVGAGNVTVNGVTAVNRGAVNFAAILSEIQAGEDVELDIVYPNGGRHYVEVTGAGYILGVPWITHVSDTLQNGTQAGVDSVQFDFVTGGNLLPLEGTGAYIDQVISESTPEPGTVILVAAALAFLTRKRRPAAR